MPNEKLLALAAFAAIVLLLSLGMFPSARKLDGRQKYRRLRRPGADADPETNRWQDIPPIAAFLAVLTGAAHADDAHASDASHTHGDVDGGDAGHHGDAGSGDGGGDGGGGK